MSFHPAAVETLDAADFCLIVPVDSRTGSRGEGTPVCNNPAKEVSK